MLHVLNIPPSDLVAFVVAMGEKPFRAKQILEWVWRKGAADFEAMTNLGKPLRERLSAEACVFAGRVANTSDSTDGTRKLLIEWSDGQRTETVGIPRDRPADGVRLDAGRLRDGLRVLRVGAGRLDPPSLRRRDLRAGSPGRSPVRPGGHERRVHGAGRAAGELRRHRRRRPSPDRPRPRPSQRPPDHRLDRRPARGPSAAWPKRTCPSRWRSPCMPPGTTSARS